MTHAELDRRLLERAMHEPMARTLGIAPSERKPNRTRERPAGRSQDEIRVSKRAARYARPFIFGHDE